MEIPFFRREVLTAQSTQWAGTIVLARPLSMKLAAGVSAVLVVALVLFSVFGEYTRKVRVTGQLVPAGGALKVVTPQFGRLISRNVQDGELVSTGKVMFELTAERTSGGAGVDARIDAAILTRRQQTDHERIAKTRQLEDQKRSLNDKEMLIVAEIARLTQEIGLQEQRVTTAAKLYRKYALLRRKGFVSDLGMAPVENDHIEQQAKRQALARMKLISQRDLLQVQMDSKAVNSEIQVHAAQTERGIASLEQEAAEHEGRSRIQVQAPGAGIVTALAVELGQTVSAGATLATILPTNSSLEAHLLVPSRAVGFIAPGQSVSLRLAAFPYQKFGQPEGIVVRVERSPIGEQPGGATSSDPMYRVVVRLPQQSVSAYGRKQDFKSGMTLEADIRQDRRRLIEWVIDPLISAAKGRTG